MTHESIDDLLELVDTFESNGSGADPLNLVSRFKTNGLLFPLVIEPSPEEVFQHAFELLYRIGAVSIPFAVGLAMHLYLLSAIATYPLEKGSPLEVRRRRMLGRIVDGRLLIANTGGADAVLRPNHKAKILAERSRNGFIVNGGGTFMSLARSADLVAFTAEAPDLGVQSFLAPVGDAECIHIGGSPFSTIMDLSDTHYVTFNNYFVEDSCRLSGGAIDPRPFAFQRAWFQALIPAVYLGAAGRSFQELRSHLGVGLRENGNGHAGNGLPGDVGRLFLAQEAAMTLAKSAGASLARYATGEDISVDEVLQSTAIAKYFGTRHAEAVVTETRRMVGARAMSAGSVLERISRTIQFGTLHPSTGPAIENWFGRRFLEEETRVPSRQAHPWS